MKEFFISFLFSLASMKIKRKKRNLLQATDSFIKNENKKIFKIDHYKKEEDFVPNCME
jgi:hypothetical protein